MATVDNIVRFEPGIVGTEVVRAQLTGASSTFVSRLGTVTAAHVDVEGTNSCTWTRSGRTITLTGTEDDYVDITCYGRL